MKKFLLIVGLVIIVIASYAQQTSIPDLGTSTESLNTTNDGSIFTTASNLNYEMLSEEVWALNLISTVKSVTVDDEIKLDEEQAQEVFQEMFQEKLDNITKKDVEKAEEILQDLINGSCPMSIIHKLYLAVWNRGGKLRLKLANIIRKQGSTCDGDIYQSVFNAIKIKWVTDFQLRKQLGEWQKK